MSCNGVEKNWRQNEHVFSIWKNNEVNFSLFNQIATCRWTHEVSPDETRNTVYNLIHAINLKKLLALKY